MKQGVGVRVLLAAGALLGLASCSYYGWPSPTSWVWTPPPGQLTLSNYRFEQAPIEAVMAAGPDCAAPDPSTPATDFVLLFKGTRVLVAAPNSDICWRRQLANGQWTDWNRAFTASGRFIDTQI
jgi:hypothetical protein